MLNIEAACHTLQAKHARLSVTSMSLGSAQCGSVLLWGWNIQKESYLYSKVAILASSGWGLCKTWGDMCD